MAFTLLVKIYFYIDSDQYTSSRGTFKTQFDMGCHLHFIMMYHLHPKIPKLFVYIVQFEIFDII
jgi:hypothetical protein